MKSGFSCRTLALTACSAFFFSCLSLLPLPAEAKPLHVVASFSILGDLAKEVGGTAVEVRSLVGPNGDAHTYQPTPRDAKAIAEADVIFINGLHLEGWMTRLITAAKADSRVVVASQGVKPRTMEDEEEGKIIDPHAWQDVHNTEIYVRNIAQALEKAAPDQAKAIQERADSYEGKLESLDQKIRTTLKAIPQEKRKIITSHDAFGYFGAAYGVTFLAPQGISTEAEPSAANVAKLIRQIKRHGIHEVFIENMTDPRLVKQIAKETHARLGGALYADALSKTDGPAPTYLAMMEQNLALLSHAMQETLP